MRWRAAALVTVALAAATTSGPSLFTAAGATVAAPRTGPYASSVQVHAEAVSLAHRILRETPTTSGESRFTGKVPIKLRNSNQFPATSNLVTRKRYWTIDGSVRHTYLTLKATHVHGLRLDGYGDTGQTAKQGFEAQLFYMSTKNRAAVVESEVFIELAHHGAGHTLIAAYAQVVPHPARARSEWIAPSGNTVEVTRFRSLNNKRTGSRTVTLDRAETKELVVAFDHLYAAPPAECSPGVTPNGTPVITEKVKITTPTYHWTIDYPGECGTVPVNRGTGVLASLSLTKAFGRDVVAPFAAASNND